MLVYHEFFLQTHANNEESNHAKKPVTPVIEDTPNIPPSHRHIDLNKEVSEGDNSDNWAKESGPQPVFNFKTTSPNRTTQQIELNPTG